MYGKEKQFYFPHCLPMNSDNVFKKSDWIGQQKAWASAPAALRKIAAQYFLIPQTVESLGRETRRPLMLSLKSRMRSLDRVASSSKIVFAPFEDFKKTIVHSLGVTVTCTKIVQFRGPCHLSPEPLVETLHTTVLIGAGAFGSGRRWGQGRWWTVANSHYVPPSARLSLPRLSLADGGMYSMWLKVLPRIVEPHQALGQSASQVAPAKRYYIWFVVAQPGLLSFSLRDLKEGKIYAAAMVKRKCKAATTVLVPLDEETIPIAIVVPKYLCRVCPIHIRLRQPQGFLLTSGCSMSGQFMRMEYPWQW
ncbi:hypothetical protein DFH08DRAFT_811806 [Mycena albidolilacea]|uniref:Uncharacterized protein n=1 Tax=Mycena albidolilacea TaxID=1033008 RepID=A0AAD6ZUN2_9AGAR|nr:hypothetical protein DFH08DRAFT_811806 [Mycena albidolilacea]